MRLIRKCGCGCDEVHKGIEIGSFFVLYFEDCGEWWFKIGHNNYYLSYSPCQGLWWIVNNKGEYKIKELL